MLSTYILISITIILTLIIVLYFGHAATVSQANEAIYNSLELVSTAGVFDESMYMYLMDNLDKLSRGNTGNRYTLQIKLEKRISGNNYETFIENSRMVDKDIKESNIIGVPLSMGDRLSVVARDGTPTLFGSIIKGPMLLYKSESERSFNGTIAVSGSTVVSNTDYNMVRGYDVIAEIAKVQDSSDIYIRVITKLNPEGRVYSHDSNTYYGDEPSESGNINTETGHGKDFIFGNGYFTRLVEEADSSQLRITFIQH